MSRGISGPIWRTVLASDGADHQWQNVVQCSAYSAADDERVRDAQNGEMKEMVYPTMIGDDAMDAAYALLHGIASKVTAS